MLEGIYDRIQYLGRKGEFEECPRSNRRIQARISARHGRYSKTGIKREHSEREIYQGDLQQENYLDGQTRDITKNIGEDWKEIEDDGKKNNQGKEKWK